ncbi:hypothetical protein CH252_04930 [Rhodococcus sp. 06-1477-1B]|nr:hypothetical protein CH252_04930 [Rhodococcus sp. 06-1477-1B]
MGHRIITGLRLNRFGQLNRNGIERPQGGGLNILAMKLHCDPFDVEMIPLENWMQVWVNRNQMGTGNNPVLSRMVTALTGQEHSLGGAGLFVATVPQRWEMIGLSADQEARLWQVWESNQ